MLKLGEKLPNGAVVLDQRGGYVLCYWEGKAEPFVVWWLLNDDGPEVVSGWYTRDVVAAAQHFEKVAGKYENTH